MAYELLLDAFVVIAAYLCRPRRLPPWKRS